MLSFSPPHIDKKILDAVSESLLSGWITTGPRTKLFEKKITEYTGCKATLCLNSATAGLELMLRWFGIKEGDEVIIPAYTYCATANVVIHCGAKPVFADVSSHDSCLSLSAVEKAVTPKTKAIMPVDFAGYPCDYNAINCFVNKPEIRKLFSPSNAVQKQLGRILVLSDAAHSFGAYYHGKKTGCLTDLTVFSFHAVKNLTTAEGGAVALNLPIPFNNKELYKTLCVTSLHGQNKDALAKTQKGNWRYDVVEAGYKCNMTDMAAAIGLTELERYDNDILKKRKQIFEKYSECLARYEWAQLPVTQNETTETESSYHVYPLRIKGITETQRDEIIKHIFDKEVAVNVHFIPLPMLSFYKNAGYEIIHYPISYDNYAREISLPVFYDLTNEQINTVLDAVISSVQEIRRTANTNS